MATQPIWKFVANLGDASPIEHGGYFLYHDETGTYGFEAERLECTCEEEDRPQRWSVHRVCLDRLQLTRNGDTLYLVPAAYDETWPHPVAAYVEWFAKDLEGIADTMGTTRGELEQALCSEDGTARAWAYRCIYDYHGWDNGDAYPLILKKSEVKARYTEGELD